MAYKIALHFEDGATRFIECGRHESVVDAACRAGINRSAASICAQSSGRR